MEFIRRLSLVRLLIATLLAVLGTLPGCTQLASMGIGFTLSPLGIELRLTTDQDVAHYTIVATTQPSTQPSIEGSGTVIDSGSTITIKP